MRHEQECVDQHPKSETIFLLITESFKSENLHLKLSERRHKLHRLFSKVDRCGSPTASVLALVELFLVFHACFHSHHI